MPQRDQPPTKPLTVYVGSWAASWRANWNLPGYNVTCFCIMFLDSCIGWGSWYSFFQLVLPSHRRVLSCCSSPWCKLNTWVIIKDGEKDGDPFVGPRSKCYMYWWVPKQIWSICLYTEDDDINSSRQEINRVGFCIFDVRNHSSNTIQDALRRAFASRGARLL
jgi:hypothetical protein